MTEYTFNVYAYEDLVGTVTLMSEQRTVSFETNGVHLDDCSYIRRKVNNLATLDYNGWESEFRKYLSQFLEKSKLEGLLRKGLSPIEIAYGESRALEPVIQYKAIKGKARTK